MADDRKCDLKDECYCVQPEGIGSGYRFDIKKADSCEHFHMPCPPIIQSKQDRLRMTRQAWDRKRDKMMRVAEKRLDKLKPQAEQEEKLREIRANPKKHLAKKGIKPRGMVA